MVMRIGGLASGMDIDSIVEKLMTAERTPYNKLLQTKQKNEWQRDAYRDVNKSLKAFDDFLSKEMTLQKDLYKKNVVSTNSAVSAVSTTSENGQTLRIDSIDQLARAGSASGKIVAKDANGTTIPVTGSSKLSDLGIVAAGASTEVKLKVLQDDGKMKDVTLNFSSEDTIDNVINKLKKDTGLNAFFDQKSGQIAISTKATGVSDEKFRGREAAEGSVEGGTNQGSLIVNKSTSIYVESGTAFFDKLGFGNSNFLAEGQNAKVTINGAQIERQSNTFELEGMRITLNNTYNGSTGQPIDLTTKVDADNMVDKIKKFVETYNGLVDSLNGLVKEQKYRDFAPLTDEQKKEMDEKEIEAWEKKAKSGLLRNDNILNSALNAMRTTMYSKGGGKQDIAANGTDPSQNFINTLFEMGITTTSKTSDRGKLEINEDKLREAIEKDPEQVYKTFSDSTTGNEGIVQKLRANIKRTTIDIETKAGKAEDPNTTHQLGRTLNDNETRIKNWLRKLEDIEARYWKQFTAMESAINKANQQSSMFMPQ